MFLYWLDKLEPSLVPRSEQASLAEAVQSKAFEEFFPFKQKALQGLGFVCSRFGEFLLPAASEAPTAAGPPYASGTVARTFVHLLRTNKYSSNAKLVDLRSQVELPHIYPNVPYLIFACEYYTPTNTHTCKTIFTCSVKRPNAMLM